MSSNKSKKQTVTWIYELKKTEDIGTSIADNMYKPLSS